MLLLEGWSITKPKWGLAHGLCRSELASTEKMGEEGSESVLTPVGCGLKMWDILRRPLPLTV